MSRCTVKSVKVLKLSPKLGLPQEGVFRCGHSKDQTGVFISGFLRCEPCYNKARRTYRKYLAELRSTL